MKHPQCACQNVFSKKDIQEYNMKEISFKFTYSIRKHFYLGHIMSKVKVEDILLFTYFVWYYSLWATEGRRINVSSSIGNIPKTRQAQVMLNVACLTVF